MADIDTQIERSNETAEAAEDRLVSLVDSAQSAANNYSSTGEAITVTAPIVESLPFDPRTDLSATFQTDFDGVWNDLESWIRGMMADWMNTYFPTLDQQLGVAEDAWLLNVINNGYSGLPDSVERMIWDRARAKDSVEAMRLEDEAVVQFSSRGFSLPPGVLANRLLQVQQEAANKSSTIARDLAIKQVEISIDMIKFAVGEVSKLRLGIAAALADFIRAWMAVPAAAAEIAKAKAEMHKVLWNSSADYMRAQAEIARLSLDAQKTNSSLNIELKKLNAQLWESHTKMRVDAAISGAHEMGYVAAAARGAQNTLVGAVEQSFINASSS